MFEILKRLPDDPILGLISLYREDASATKVDLGAGVYQDETGATPIFVAVKDAERRVWERQTTKTYEGLAGSAAFNKAIQEMILGASHPALREGRVATVQTTGGSGGLHVVAGMIGRARSDATIWFSEPTWPNHRPLIGDGKLNLVSHPYYDAVTHRVDLDGMVSALEGANRGDLVVLHGCCHNPTGADLSPAQWDALLEVFERRGLVPFIDMAYQGLASSVDEDAYGVRLFAERLPESIVVTSCSKNFGLYRDRVGSASVVTSNAQQAAVCASHLGNVTRTVYSMPPAHGAAVVECILSDSELRSAWLAELGVMRDRLNGLRRKLAQSLESKTGSDRFAFIAAQRGMFSLLGLSGEQIERLREEFHIYMVASSRANIAGVSDANLDYVSGSIAAVL